jgi:hypothetical protein
VIDAARSCLVTPRRKSLDGEDDQKIVSLDLTTRGKPTMPAMIKTVVVVALIISSVSAALARQTFVPVNPVNPNPVSGSCFTDEGQGRRIPCSSGI